MRRKDLFSDEGPEPEVIAVFGGARLIRIQGKHKRLEVRGGTDGEQRQAREWAKRFLTDASERPRPNG